MMEQRINIAKLLKDCPKGMELDCSLYDNVTLVQVKEGYDYPIVIETPNGQMLLSKYGCFSKNELAKCIIFPKGKTTWEGFQIPFKDGDIVAASSGNWIGITTGGKSREFMPTYCVIKGDGKFEAYLDKKETWQFSRFATEEEKAKLFDAIKDNGYKWNEETKTLEKLIQPKFKVGDVIQDKGGYKVRITNVSIEDEYYGYESLAVNGIGGISFNRQDEWELVPNKFDITTLKPFESKVLVRHNKDNKWCGSFFSHIDGNFHSNCYKYVTVAGKSYPMCIPYEKNEHLLGTTNDCEEFYKNW